MTNKKCKYCDSVLRLYKNTDKSRLQKQWCSVRCQMEYRKQSGYWVSWYQKQPEVILRNKRKCIICKRNIKKVGLMKNINKYCSKRCRIIGAGIKFRGQKYVEVKMTFPQYRRYVKNA